MLLWLGLATLIVTLVVLICTSWGQSHPLRKCAGLSLLAHLLLFGYATTVQIVTGTGNGHHGGGMNLLLIDGSADGADVGIDDPEAPLTDTPWNRPPRGEPAAQPADTASQQKSPSDAVVDPPPEVINKTPTAPTLAETQNLFQYRRRYWKLPTSSLKQNRPSRSLRRSAEVFLKHRTPPRNRVCPVYRR